MPTDLTFFSGDGYVVIRRKNTTLFDYQTVAQYRQNVGESAQDTLVRTKDELNAKIAKLQKRVSVIEEVLNDLENGNNNTKES